MTKGITLSDSKLQAKLTKLAEELRGSSFPVSAFFLVSSVQTIDRMVQCLNGLSSFGVTTKQINAIAKVVGEAFDRHSFDHDYYKTCEIGFQIDDSYRKGNCCYTRNIPGKGFEVEITLPGIIASSASGFIDNNTGFWTAFLPPSFYR